MGGRAGGPGGRGWGVGVWRQLGAMHVSGGVLLLTFLVPPAWMADAGYATPPGDPTAEAPFLLLLAVPLVCAVFHVTVQMPAGLLGAWLGGSRSTWVGYGSAVVAAGGLSLLLLRASGWEAGPGTVAVWADLMVRGALGLAGYMWVVRARPGSQPA